MPRLLLQLKPRLRAIALDEGHDLINVLFDLREKLARLPALDLLVAFSWINPCFDYARFSVTGPTSAWDVAEVNSRTSGKHSHAQDRFLMLPNRRLLYVIERISHRSAEDFAEMLGAFS